MMGKKKFKTQGSEFKKVDEAWRKPKGGDSKSRLEKKDKPDIVKIGYKKPDSERGIHPSGYREVLVHNVSDAKDVDSESHAIRIASNVGGRKREDILEFAHENDIKVLNDRRDKDETEDAEEDSS